MSTLEQIQLEAKRAREIATLAQGKIDALKAQYTRAKATTAAAQADEKRTLGLFEAARGVSIEAHERAERLEAALARRAQGKDVQAALAGLMAPHLADAAERRRVAEEQAAQEKRDRLGAIERAVR